MLHPASSLYERISALQFLSEFSLSTLYKNYTKNLKNFQIFKVRIPNIEALLLVPTLKFLSIAYTHCTDPSSPLYPKLQSTLRYCSIRNSLFLSTGLVDGNSCGHFKLILLLKFRVDGDSKSFEAAFHLFILIPYPI